MQNENLTEEQRIAYLWLLMRLYQKAQLSRVDNIEEEDNVITVYTAKKEITKTILVRIFDIWRTTPRQPGYVRVSDGNGLVSFGKDATERQYFTFGENNNYVDVLYEWLKAREYNSTHIPENLTKILDKLNITERKVNFKEITGLSESQMTVLNILRKRNRS